MVRLLNGFQVEFVSKKRTVGTENSEKMTPAFGVV